MDKPTMENIQNKEVLEAAEEKTSLVEDVAEAVGVSVSAPEVSDMPPVPEAVGAATAPEEVPDTSIEAEADADADTDIENADADTESENADADTVEENADTQEEESDEEPQEEDEEEDGEDDDFVPPAPLLPRKKNTKQTVLLLLGALLVMFLVYASTSLIYKLSRGESWDPFAFLKRKTTEARLPTIPSVPANLLTSITNESNPLGPDGTTGGSGLPTIGPSPALTSEDSTTAVSDTTAVTDSTDSSPEETETAEPDSSQTDSSASESTSSETDESLTEESTTAEDTTQATTTQAPATTEAATTTQPTTTEEEIDFTDITAHVSAAGMDLSDLAGNQQVVVQGSGDGKALLYFFEKVDDKWMLTEALPVTAGSVSQAGIETGKTAGSAATPGGYFSIGPVFGQAASALTSMPYQQIQEGDRLITDPASAYYNQIVGSDQKQKDWNSAWEMGGQQEAFKYAVLVNYNTAPADPALGHATFLLVQSDQDTQDAIAIRESALFALLQWLAPEKDPHILIYAYEADHE